MSGVESNPALPQESKSAKKKKAKAEAAAKDVTVQPSIESEAIKTNVENPTNGADGAYESPYMKELYKYVRGTVRVEPLIRDADDETGASGTLRRSW